MANSLAPSFVRIVYHSSFGSHLMTIPTTQWSPGTGQGTFVAWDASDRDADTMINELVDALAENAPDDMTFDYYTIFNIAAPTEEEPNPLPVPVAEALIGTVGGSVTPGWFKAAELTFSFHTTAFGIFKLVLLDGATADNWDKITSTGTLTAIQDIIDAVTAITNGWSGRDNAQPLSFTQLAKTLNEKLRRNYNMN